MLTVRNSLGIYRLIERVGKRIYHINMSQRKSGVVILISDKVDKTQQSH